MDNKWIKRIEVKGGYITFDLSKPGNLNQLSKVILEASQEAVNGRREEEIINSRGFCHKVAGEFDRIFGQEACLKTFGTSVPTIKQFEEFTDKFGLLIDQWIKEK